MEAANINEQHHIDLNASNDDELNDEEIDLLMSSAHDEENEIIARQKKSKR